MRLLCCILMPFEGTLQWFLLECCYAIWPTHRFIDCYIAKVAIPCIIVILRTKILLTTGASYFHWPSLQPPEPVDLPDSGLRYTTVNVLTDVKPTNQSINHCYSTRLPILNKIESIGWPCDSRHPSRCAARRCSMSIY